MENKPKKTKQLLKSEKDIKKAGMEVSLEELESLCYNFDRRPRGCNPGQFVSIGDNDDVLF